MVKKEAGEGGNQVKIKSGLEKEYADYVIRNSNDDYSKGVVDFTERWASTIESALPPSPESSQVTTFLEGNAERLSHEADSEGITGFMYGCAVQALAYFWVYGEELRRWHNLDTQIQNEGERANETGGVLNPAVLNIE